MLEPEIGFNTNNQIKRINVPYLFGTKITDKEKSQPVLHCQMLV